MPLPLKRWEGAIALATRRESGDRSAKLRAKAHCPLFPGQRRTLMFRKRSQHLRSLLHVATKFILFLSFVATLATTAQAQSVTIHGRILDPLGNPVAQAKVTLIQEGREDKSLADSTSSPDG